MVILSHTRRQNQTLTTKRIPIFVLSLIFPIFFCPLFPVMARVVQRHFHFYVRREVKDGTKREFYHNWANSVYNNRKKILENYRYIVPNFINDSFNSIQPTVGCIDPTV